MLVWIPDPEETARAFKDSELPSLLFSDSKGRTLLHASSSLTRFLLIWKCPSTQTIVGTSLLHGTREVARARGKLGQYRKFWKKKCYLETKLELIFFIVLLCLCYFWGKSLDFLWCNLLPNPSSNQNSNHYWPPPCMEWYQRNLLSTKLYLILKEPCQPKCTIPTTFANIKC